MSYIFSFVLVFLYSGFLSAQTLGFEVELRSLSVKTTGRSPLVFLASEKALLKFRPDLHHGFKSYDPITKREIAQVPLVLSSPDLQLWTQAGRLLADEKFREKPDQLFWVELARTANKVCQSYAVISVNFETEPIELCVTFEEPKKPEPAPEENILVEEEPQLGRAWVLAGLGYLSQDYQNSGIQFQGLDYSLGLGAFFLEDKLEVETRYGFLSLPDGDSLLKESLFELDAYYSSPMIRRVSRDLSLLWIYGLNSRYRLVHELVAAKQFSFVQSDLGLGPNLGLALRWRHGSELRVLTKLFVSPSLSLYAKGFYADAFYSLNSDWQIFLGAGYESLSLDSGPQESRWFVGTGAKYFFEITDLGESKSGARRKF